MLEKCFSHYLCFLLSLLVLTSEVHSVDSEYKYLLSGSEKYRSPPEMKQHPKNPKLFTLEGTWRSRNDETMKAFGREVKIAASAFAQELQGVEVIANNVKWAARINQGDVEDVESSWVGPVNVDPLQAVMSLFTKKRGETLPSHIKSLMLHIYKRSAFLRDSQVQPGSENVDCYYYKDFYMQFN